MSCQNNANAAVGSGIKSGISAAAGKAAYIGGGVGVGATVGVLGGPVGVLAGGLAGGVAGQILSKDIGRRKAARRLAEAEEKTWQRSEAGQKAVGKRDKKMQAATAAYEKKRARLKAQAGRARAEYESAKEAGMDRLAENRSGGLKGIASSAEAKAGAKAAGSALLNVAGTIIGDEIHRGQQRRNPNPYPRTRSQQETAWKAAGNVTKEVKGYKERVQQEREQAWKNTTEGKASVEKYKKAARQLETWKREVVRDYNLNKKNIKAKYDLSRDSFLRGHRAEA